MPAAGEHDELRVRDRCVELVGDAERRAGVELAPDEQGGHGDLGEQVALIGLGHHEQLRLQALRADSRGDLVEQRDELGRRAVGEQAREGGVEVGRRDHLPRALDPGADLLLRQRALPARVAVGEDERRDEVRAVAVELLRDRPAPREAGHVGRA